MANILLISITVLQTVVIQMQIQASGGDAVMLEGLWQSLLLGMPEEKSSHTHQSRFGFVGSAVKLWCFTLYFR